ncbi:SDR family NAD(P)-dependent oxidoreductase [Paenibacillus sp. TC-CSREp1]|uniref:SDR family NAD(P)-dependent oxidoreductase n=1 Tax=Paenibacillus sp. TC-CSREp1 TaxID=3410089 RepID=UPI003CEE8520
MNNTHLLRTALVTGSTSGIGLELTRKLLTDQWQVIGLNRSAFPEHPDIQAALASGQLYAVQADLTNYSSLHAALEHIRFKTKAIDVLFNNAGGSTPRLLYSAQGHELHFELQTVVPYIIYRELYPLLREGRMKTVVNTSTTAFRMLKSFNLQTLEQPASFKKLFGPYAASKLALSLWTQEAAAAAKADGIHLLSVDPGGNNTLRANKLSGIPFYIKPVMKLFFPPPTRGASLLYAAGLGNTTHDSGSYLVNNKPARLRFTEQSAAVLHRVEHIYKHKFQSPS